jgi:uncharacterized protein (TIGR03083 family)
VPNACAVGHDGRVPATLAAVTRDLHEQWDLLRAWVDELPDPSSDEPSTLPGWSLGVLVAHLGRTMDALAACRPATADDGPARTLGGYLASYRGVDPSQMDVLALEVAAQVADDPLAHLDAFAEAGLARLEELTALGESDGRGDGENVVVARRGAIRLRDFAMSRLVELVVHAYDLAPALPLPVPVDPTARTLVASALAELVLETSGHDVVVADERAWILAVTGRLPWAAAAAQGAVRAGAVSDGVPDLSDTLPLL